MNRHAITVALIAAAALCYFTGWKIGGVALFIAGGALELAFWLRVFGDAKTSTEKKPPA
jgi:hypothetical protein